MGISSLSKKILFYGITIVLVRIGQCDDQVESNYTLSFLDPEWINISPPCNELSETDGLLKSLYYTQLDKFIDILIFRNKSELYDIIRLDFKNKQPNYCDLQTKKIDFASILTSTELGNGKIVIVDSQENLRATFNSLVIDPMNCSFIELPKVKNRYLKVDKVYPYEGSFDVLYVDKKSKYNYFYRYKDDGELVNSFSVLPTSNDWREYPWTTRKVYDSKFGFYFLDVKLGETIIDDATLSIGKLDSNYQSFKEYAVQKEKLPRRDFIAFISVDLYGCTMCLAVRKEYLIKCYTFDAELNLLHTIDISIRYELLGMAVYKLSGNDLAVFYVGQNSTVTSEKIFHVQLANEKGKYGDSLEMMGPLGHSTLDTYEIRDGSYCIITTLQETCHVVKRCINVSMN